MNIGERIRYLRKEKLEIKSCDSFGLRIGLSGSNMRNIETGRVNATERVLTDISQEFSVNMDWLLNGGSDEDIFMKFTEEAEIATYIQDLLDSEDDIIADSIKEFIVIYEKLDDSSKQVLKNIGNEFLDRMKNK